MIKEVIKKAATVDEAAKLAAEELGVDLDKCSVEVLEEPKKSFFGKMKDAKVKVIFEQPDDIVNEENTSADSRGIKLAIAKQYINDILIAMGLENISVIVEEDEKGATITFEGEGVAVLIGHHGETLDALQYLVALTCNRTEGEYYRITLDCGNYRQKREETLKALASRIANNVKRTGRSQLLEPMNPYERRIIHSVVSDVEGVSSRSKGEEPNRRVLIISDNPRPRNNNRGEYKKYNNPAPQKRERTMEEILKGEIKDKVDSAELYSKIEL